MTLDCGMDGTHRVLVSRDRIAARVAEMARQITADLERGWSGSPADHRVELVPVLTGAMVFVADLIRAMPVKMSIRPISVSSYPGASLSTQGVTIRGELPTDLRGRHVLLVDDILDSGRTLGLLRRVFSAQEPASLRVAVLLRKRKHGGRDEEVVAEYAGFDIEDEFVVGYGLDYDGLYRNLPDIGVLELNRSAE